jgi:hypothetical protein
MPRGHEQKALEDARPLAVRDVLVIYGYFGVLGWILGQVLLELALT